MPGRSLLSPRNNTLRVAAFGTALGTIAVALVLGWRLYGEKQRRDFLMQAIQQAGGSTSFRAPQSADGRIRTFLSRIGIRGDDQRGETCELLLNGEQFDDAWLANLDQLRGLPLSGLIVVRSRLSPDGVCRLVGAHQMQLITAPGIALTDDHAGQWATQPDLRFLNLNRTEISDAALPSLGPQQLGSLYVGGTRVTAQGLEALRGSTHLRALGLDGRQFSEISDELLGSLRSLRHLVLIGPDVTDEHLARVARMPRIRLVYLERTSVTPEGAAGFRAAREDCRLQMPQPGNEVIPW